MGAPKDAAISRETHNAFSAVIVALGVLALILDRCGIHGDADMVFWIGLGFAAYGGIARNFETTPS